MHRLLSGAQMRSLGPGDGLAKALPLMVLT